jgi:hypothetical protein
MSSTAIRPITSTALSVIVSPEPTKSKSKKQSTNILRAPTKGITLRDRASFEASLRRLTDKLDADEALIVQTIKNNRGLSMVEYARILAGDDTSTRSMWFQRISKVLTKTQQGKRLAAYGAVALAPIGRTTIWFASLPKSYQKRVPLREGGTQVSELDFNGSVNDDIKRDVTEARQGYLAAFGRRWLSSNGLDNIARGDSILAYQAVNASQAQIEMANLERRISLLGREMDKIGTTITEIGGLNGLIRKVSGLVAQAAR